MNKRITRRRLAQLGFVSTTTIVLTGLVKKTLASEPLQKVSLPKPPSWIEDGKRYVYVVNGIAKIDPAIEPDLVKSDVDNVRAAVNYYNALKPENRAFRGINSNAPKTASIANDSCNYLDGLYIADVQWYAVTIHIGNCLANDLAAGLVTDAAIAAGLAAIFPPALVPAVLVAVYLAADGAFLAAYSADCSNSGAYFNFVPWNPAIFWPSRAC